MDERMRSAAGSRPVLAAAGIVLVALLVALAAGAFDRIAPAPAAGDATRSLEILAEAPSGTSPRVRDVAVETILSALRSDPAVTGASSARGRDTSTVIAVRLAVSGEHEAEGVISRIQGHIDPGPLRLRFAATPLVLAAARSSVQGQLGRLELLVAPFAILVLVAAAGLRAGALAVLAGAIALAGALAVLRLTDGYLVAFAPAAAIGIAQAIELAALYGAIHREESLLAGAGGPLSRALRAWRGPAVATTAVRSLAPLALLVTPFAEASSIAVASAAAALLAPASIAVLGPWLLGVRARRGGGEVTAEGRPSRALRAAPRVLARSPLTLGAVLVLAVGASAALGFEVHEAASSPFVANDLPAGSQARESAAALAAASPADGTGAGVPSNDNPLTDLTLAAALVAIGVGLALPRGHVRRAAAVLSLLPAAAALGLLVLVVQHGHLADALTGRRPSLVQGAVVACVAAVAAISAGRTVLAASVARREALRGVWRIGAAEVTGGLTIPGATASTLIVAGSFAVLAGADLGAARELGVGVAAGVVLDLVLIRLPFLAVLARWRQ